MRRFLLALAIAFCAAVAPMTEASAASVTIRENGITIRDGYNDGYRYHRRHYRDDRHRGWRNGRHYGWRNGRHHGWRNHCRVRTVKTYRHHRVIIRKVRVCR